MLDYNFVLGTERHYEIGKASNTVKLPMTSLTFLKWWRCAPGNVNLNYRGFSSLHFHDFDVMTSNANPIPMWWRQMQNVMYDVIGKQSNQNAKVKFEMFTKEQIGKTKENVNNVRY